MHCVHTASASLQIYGHRSAHKEVGLTTHQEGGLVKWKDIVSWDSALTGQLFKPGAPDELRCGELRLGNAPQALQRWRALHPEHSWVHPMVLSCQAGLRGFWTIPHTLTWRERPDGMPLRPQSGLYVFSRVYQDCPKAARCGLRLWW